MTTEQLQNLAIWRDEFEGDDAAFLAMANAVVSETQLVSTTDVAVYIANKPTLRNAIFALSQSPVIEHRAMFYAIELAFKMSQVDLKNAEFEKINDLAALGAESSDIAGFFALGTVQQTTEAAERFDGVTEITENDLARAALLPKLAQIDQAMAELTEARKEIEAGRDVDLSARGVE